VEVALDMTYNQAVTTTLLSLMQMLDLTIIKIRLWAGIGFGFMPVKYRDVTELWLVILFVRVRVSKERIVGS
jgi:hypothetical protein